MTMIEITLVVMAVSLIGFAFHLLYLVKDVKVLIAWSITLAVTEITVYLMGYEFKWYVLAILPFYLFSVAYMLVKIKKRINAAIAHIEKREKEEEAKKEIIETEETPYGK